MEKKKRKVAMIKTSKDVVKKLKVKKYKKKAKAKLKKKPSKSSY